MMITKIQLAAMSRVDVPEKERRDFYLYIDEFQNFSTDSFANILSEARKYRLNLILAHQYIEQLSEKVKPAVFGNVGTMVVFRVGAADAEELVKEFTPTFTEEDIVNLPKYEMYLKLMIDGIASTPFSARGLPPLRAEEKTGNDQVVINYSRERYASERAMVEEKIMRWHESFDEPTSAGQATAASRPGPAPLAPRPAAPSVYPQPTYKAPAAAVAPVPSAPRPVKEAPRRSGYEATCSGCGRPTTTVFVPDGIRPVYCKDCLGRKKEEKRLNLEKRHLAKEIEKRHLEENSVLVKTPPPLSLSDLSKAQPVDFRGRKLKEEAPRPVFLKESIIKEDERLVEDIFSGFAKDSQPAGTEDKPREFDLTEGEDLNINQ
jgi:CxxC-x17-CxxC domain-containing protein